MSSDQAWLEAGGVEMRVQECVLCSTRGTRILVGGETGRRTYPDGFENLGGVWLFRMPGPLCLVFLGRPRPCACYVPILDGRV